MIKRFFGWLLATDSYLATLTDDQLLERALGRKGAAAYKAKERTYDDLVRSYRNDPPTITYH